MNFMFSIFSIIFVLVFLVVFYMIGLTIVGNIKREHKNDHSPRLTVEVKVVSKRTNFHRSPGEQGHMGHGHTTYFVTFEVKSGDRMELSVTGPEYGLLVEGDFGELTFQGTRYLRFERKVPSYDL